MYTIFVQSEFSSAHNLRGYQGECEALHGHNWKVRAEIASEKLNKLGMVCDFKELKQKLNRVVSTLDHRYLNKLKFFKKNNPTSEKVAEFIFYQLKKLIKDRNLILHSVSVWESETSSATFSEVGN